MQKIIILTLMTLLSNHLMSQISIWSEDFSSYSVNSGIDHSGSIGDYPAGVSKWTLDGSGADLENEEDYAKVVSVYSNRVFEIKDSGGDIIWESEPIDLNAYASVTFSLDARELGTMESSDYYDVYYSLNGGEYNLIANWNSLGSDSHTLIGNWSETSISVFIGTETSLRIKVIVKNNSGTEKMRLDNVLVSGYALENAQWNVDASNTDWNKATNWSTGTIPHQGTNVTIPSSASSYPVITNTPDAPAICNNLIVLSGANLEISSGKALTVHADLSVSESKAPGTLIIESDETGTGSMIVKGSASGSISMKQYIVGYGEASNHWHLISTPVNCSDIPQSVTPSTTDFDLFYWQESANLWYNYNGGSFSDTQICNAKGYLASYKNNNTIIFTGTPNSGSFTSGTGEMPQITYNSDQGNGWNLYGNPYTSSIDWDLITKSEQLNGAVYVRDGNIGQYISWNGTTGSLINGVIPPMNGFWVKANASEQEITISPDAQLHSSQSFYKSKSSLKNHLMFTISGNGYQDKTYVMLSDSASELFDPWIDAYKLFGVDEAPQLYTVNDVSYSINTLPLGIDKASVEMHLSVGKDESYILTYEGSDSFENLKYLELTDHKTDKNYNLRDQQTIQIDHNTDDPTHRFTIHLGFDNVKEDEYSTNDDITLFAFEDRIYVAISKEYLIPNELIVYDLLGRKVYAKSFSHIGEFILNPNLQNGLYVVSFTNKEQYSKTIYISKSL